MCVQTGPDNQWRSVDATVCAGYDGKHARTDRTVPGRGVFVGALLGVRVPQLVGGRHLGGLRQGRTDRHRNHSFANHCVFRM